jgi:hypothetical protein
MKFRTLPRAAALLAIGFAIPAVAQVYDSRMDQRVEASSFGPPAPPAVAAPPEAPLAYAPAALPDAIHAGANNAADEALADAVAAALAADSRIHGATVTVAANNGRVSLSGSARSPEQAGHAENIARSVAGVTAVSGTLQSQGG